jgi:isopentenyldiphosphate isomerase
MDEIFPLVDESGQVIGSATRRECHNGSKLLHPVVHLHVFDRQGNWLLQKRSGVKDIQPGRWDTSVGGHVDVGETIEQALRREAREELGIREFQPVFVRSYVFESDIERELVYSYKVVYEESVAFDVSEIDAVRFWTGEEIRESLGQGVFTPNFEEEFRYMESAGQVGVNEAGEGDKFLNR